MPRSTPGAPAVTINGRPSGNTPLTMNDLAPGDYRIVMTLTGYRSFATTVRVVAGERVRAAASRRCGFHMSKSCSTARALERWI